MFCFYTVFLLKKKRAVLPYIYSPSSLFLSYSVSDSLLSYCRISCMVIQPEIKTAIQLTHCPLSLSQFLDGVFPITFITSVKKEKMEIRRPLKLMFPNGNVRVRD